MRFFIILYSILNSLAASATSCPNVRIDKTSLKNVPVLDQDGSGICWAYTAATLIDAYRFSHGDKSPVISSPIGIAAQSSFVAINKGEFVNSNGIGDPGLAIKNVINSSGNICDHFVMSKFYRSTDLFLGSDFGSGVSLDQNEFHCSPVAAVLNLKDKLMVQKFRNLPLSMIRTKLKQICKDGSTTVTIPIPKQQLAHTMSNSEKSDRIKELLSKPIPQPIGISYFSEVLTQGHSFRSQFASDRHVSSVVGSRLNSKGVCQFLVRNSWGKSCTPYSWDCEKGQIWVDEDSLSKSINGFTWLE